MRKTSKKVIALIMSVMLVMSLPMTAGANSGRFRTVGGPYPKTWEYSLASKEIASAFYRLSGKISQPLQYKFNEAEIRLTLYCNGATNSVKNVTGTDVYELQAFLDASTGVTRGYGSMYVSVEDNIYGYYTYTYYN